MSSTDIKGELRDLLLRIDHHHSVERQVQTSVLADAIKHITTLEEENADLRAQLAEARKQSDFLISNRIFVEYHEEYKEYAAMSCTCSTESGRPFVEIYGWGSTTQEAIDAAIEMKGGE